MTTTEFTTTILKPSDGFVLTQANDDTPLEERTFATLIALGKNDSPDAWKEITEAEAERLKEEINKKTEIEEN